MARKTASDLKSADKLVDAAYEQFALVSSIKAELAQEVFDAQDAKTQALIRGVKAKLHQLATDTITLVLANGGKAEALGSPDDLDGNLSWLAIEIVKDLAFVGVQVGNFQFPAKSCAICGGEL